MTPDQGNERLRHSLCRYRTLRPKYEGLAAFLVQVFENMAKRLQIYPIVSGRAKSLESLAGKIGRPGKQYGDDPLADITDLCGVRVIAHTTSDIDLLCAEVERAFVIDVPNSGDKSESLRLREFGYLSRHFIVQLKPDWPYGTGAVPDSEWLPLKAELQLRTLAQHVWADVYHDLGYKNEFTLPKRWDRAFGRAAAMLEECDRVFEDVRQALRTFESDYGAYLSGEELKALAGRLEIVIETGGGTPSVLRRLLSSYVALGAREHIDAIERLIACYPDLLNGSAGTLRDAGVALTKAYSSGHERFEQGIRYLEQAIQADPADWDAHCSLGGAFRRANDSRRQLAAGCYRAAHDLDPTNPYALGQYIAEEIANQKRVEFIEYLRPAVRQASERAAQQAAAGVNLPWAWFDLGLFSLYDRQPVKAVEYYARGIAAAVSPDLIDTASRTIEGFETQRLPIPGLTAVLLLLRIGEWVRTESDRRSRLAWRAREPGAVLTPPVLVLAGGCGGLDGFYAPKLAALRDLLRGCTGTIVGGGTNSGVSLVPGALQSADSRLHTVGYLPGADPLPGGVLRDENYKTFRTSEAGDFSPLEALLFWHDCLASGVDPATVKLIGFNGGPIARCEYLMALALGAQVGLIEGSGREADKVLAELAPQAIRGARSRAEADSGGCPANLHVLSVDDRSIPEFVGIPPR